MESICVEPLGKHWEASVSTLYFLDHDPAGLHSFLQCLNALGQQISIVFLQRIPPLISDNT
jgi:hypothetical protein